MAMMSKVELAVRQVVARESGLEGAMDVPLDKTLRELAVAEGVDPEFHSMYIRFDLEDMLATSIPVAECDPGRTVRELVCYMEALRKTA